ncbi:hypothetical protein D3C86_1442510 [compost metagenome]
MVRTVPSGAVVTIHVVTPSGPRGYSSRLPPSASSHTISGLPAWRRTSSSVDLPISMPLNSWLSGFTLFHVLRATLPAFFIASSTFCWSQPTSASKEAISPMVARRLRDASVKVMVVIA